MAEVEIGLGKSGRRAYGFDELSIVPSRRTRDPEDIDLSWEIDAFTFDLPVIAAAMDGVTSPATAIEIGRLGGVALLNLEGLWTRYDDPAPLLDEIGELPADKVTVRLQEIYQEPIKAELVTARLREIRDAGAVAAGAVTPQRTARLADAIIAGEPDLLVIQGTVVSAEHVSKNQDPLNLKTFVRALDLPVLVGGCSSYQAALHLMRTGAAGVLVGVGANHACTGDAVLGIGSPQATAVADVRAARMRHLDETGVYCHVIANGGLKTGGDIAKAIVCGADAVVLGTVLAHAHEAPGRGFNWGNASMHSSLPHGTRLATPATGTIDEILFGPDHGGGGGLNLMGALRATMALTGYETIKDLQKADLMVSGAGLGGASMSDDLMTDATDPAPVPAEAVVAAVESFDTVLVVDFGAQYAQLIARRVREAHVYSEIVPHTITADEIRARNPAGVIFSGGPKSVHVEGAPTIDQAVYDTGVPVLGICYGAQLVARDLGGVVSRTGRGEYGRTDLEIVDDGGLLFGGLIDQPAEQHVWMSHFDTITAAPTGFTVLASTPDTPAAAFEQRERGLYGVQFHPEVMHTDHGQELLKHWLYEACGCRPTWTMSSIIETQVEAIRQQIGTGRALCGLSGGVDSAVAAALVHKAIGPQLTCVFVDTGLMRKDEGEQVVETFKRNFGIELIHVRAAERFFERLEGVTDPEDKRKTIGAFIRVFEDAAGGIEDASFLVQGTLYPDVIESGTSQAAKIKSHHNVGGLPDDMEFDLVEPLRLLFKDEVRRVGEELGLPEEIVWRQPFPGPGLGVRIIGEVTPDKVKTLQDADAIVREEIKRAGLEREIWQSFAVLPDIRTVGVMGDERTYGYPIVIRAVTSEDAMTADWARLPYDLLERMSSRIINEVSGVNRVAYDVTSKPPGTIEWE